METGLEAGVELAVAGLPVELSGAELFGEEAPPSGGPLADSPEDFSPPPSLLFSAFSAAFAGVFLVPDLA